MTAGPLVVSRTATAMATALGYLEQQLMGIRAGRATTAMLEYVKVECPDCYDDRVNLKQMAVIFVNDATTLTVKPFQPETQGAIVKALENTLNARVVVDGSLIRVVMPSPTAEQRKALMAQAKVLAEDAKVTIRLKRRDGISRIKDQSLSEDQARLATHLIEGLTKEYVTKIQDALEQKLKDIQG